MSRKATNEYIGARRRAYANAKPEKRKVILDDVCDTTGHSRKYANRLLTGSRKFNVPEDIAAHLLAMSASTLHFAIMSSVPVPNFSLPP